jgi:CAAX protease family protein
VNLPLLAAIDLVGGLGEEIGWRGYLQPRLDEMGVPASLLWVIALETLFHLPLIPLAGYLSGGSLATTLVLFFGLGLGATPVWTWATYRWRSVWIAAWFHAFHNAVSQVLIPKALGAADERILGESGVFPVALYLLVAATVLGIARARGKRWREFAQDGCSLSKTEPGALGLPP